MAAMADDPTEPETRVLVSPDGALIARVFAEHIELVNGSTLAVEGEIGIDASADGHDAVLIGDPLRLVVLSRYDNNVRLHVIDPRGPTAIAELPFKSAARLIGASGDHVWLAAATGSMIVDVVRKDPSIWPLPLRTPVAAAGPFTSGRFVVSTAGLIEEWDPETRVPIRRFRLGKATPARHVGGGPRQVWLVPAAELDRIEIIPLVNHGQPVRIEMPEPIARIAADPSHENLIVIGATTRTAYAVDLSGRTPVTPLEGFTAFDAAWIGATGAVAVDAVGLGLEVVPVIGRTRPGLNPDRPQVARGPAALAAIASVEVAAPTNVAERLVAWRERMRAAAPREVPSTAAWIGPTDQPATWRDHLATWARSILSGTRGEPPVLGDGPLGDVTARLGLDADLGLALWLLYGAHLCGHDGLAPAELSSVLRRRWDEALGRGALAALGVARWRKSRARLTREVVDALDERSPRYGTIVVSGTSSPDGTRAIVAPADVELDAIAQWAAPALGPIFVANRRGLAHPDRFLLEGRVRGALPVLSWPRPDTLLPPAALLVVADEAAARAVPAPVVARWPTDAA